MKKNEPKKITEDELENIQWRAGRGCHFEGGIIMTSKYGIEVIENDVPLMLVTLREFMKFRSKIQGFMASRLAIDCFSDKEVEEKYPDLYKALTEIGKFVE
jgi:hypothetical protein